MSDILVSGRGLTKRYRQQRAGLFQPASERTVLDNVDLDVVRGETLAIIGESGSGKSTLVRLLLALSQPSAGTVEFDGRSVEFGKGSLGWLRRETGIVLQDPYASLDPRFTIGRTVEEPLLALGLADGAKDRVSEVLAQVGLEPWRAAQYPHELSGGQRQRVALARALVHGPKLLIGDEPLSALDVTVRAQILELLRGLRDRLGLTIVLVSHDIGLVQHVADRIVVMHDGTIVERGETHAVLSAPAHPYTAALLAAVPSLIERSSE